MVRTKRVSRRGALKLGAAAAALPLVHIRGAEAAGKLQVGFWDHWVPAGNGAFICKLRMDMDPSLGALGVSVFCHTWISSDMMFEEQAPLLDDGAPGHRLGDALLLPAPLRQFDAVKIAGSLSVRTWTWGPGMPETLASVRGRA